MIKRSYFPLYIHLCIYFISAFLFAYSFDISMIDDGLRHIAFAANNDVMSSWGEVFPHSLFSSYDPWYMWHRLLEFLLYFVSYENVHIVVNCLSLFTLLVLVDAHFRKNINFDFSSLTYIIVLTIVYSSFYRYTMIRPDLLSGLFILSMLLIKNRFLYSFILTLIYSPFYYLFFIYTGSMGLVYLVKKEWNSFFGTLIASIISLIGFLLIDSKGYLETVKYVLTDQSLRMGLEVSEGQPLFGFLKSIDYFILLPLFLFISLYLIKKNYSYFQANAIPTFLLITSVLWFNQLRYYHLFLPIIVLFLVEILFNSNKKNLLKLLRKSFVISKRYVGFSKKVFLFYVIAIPYTIAVFAYMFNTKSQNESVNNADFFKKEFFNNKTILLNNMGTDLYKALYFNPTIKIVPSCGLGWFDNQDMKMKDIYIRMHKEQGINEEELKTLVKYVDADIYIHYLKNSNQVLDIKKLEEYGLSIRLILNNRLIFFVDKKRL